MAERILYARNEVGAIEFIDNVVSGKACNCTCLKCGEKLIARKGKKNAHSFAHINTSSKCEGYGLQTTKHLMAKEVVKGLKTIRLPAIWSESEFDGSKILIEEEMQIPIHAVFAEKKEGSIIPDLLVESNGTKFYLEMYVTHAVNEKKKTRIQRKGIPTLEIDLNDVEIGNLEENLEYEVKNKRWIYHPKIDRFEEEIRKSLDLKMFRYYPNDGLRTHCPANKRRHILPNGDFVYALQEDCKNCKYCVGVKTNSCIYCGFRNGITCIDEAVNGERKESSLDSDPYIFIDWLSIKPIPPYRLMIANDNNCFCPECNNKLVVAISGKMPVVRCTVCSYTDSDVSKAKFLFFDPKYNNVNLKADSR